MGPIFVNQSNIAMYQISFYVPASHVEQVKNALFAAGAGRLGGYEHCAWQTLGQGQFKPLPGSTPYSGKVDQLESVEEYKVEMICAEDCISAALQALLAVHPYEQPAYSICKMLTLA